MKTLLHLSCFTLFSLSANAEPAAELATKLSAMQQDGSSLVRLKMEVQGVATKVTLQLQIKQRRTGATTEVVYQVLWPKDRAGESVLLRKTGNQTATGSIFIPPDTARPLEGLQLREALLASNLSYADAVENFFTWDQQTIIGAGMVGRVNCDILESKPGKGQQSDYATVRTWVDRRRDVPLRVEKYLASGQMARRIETTRVVTNDKKQHVPANLTVSDPRQGSVTELTGSSVKYGLRFSDHEFTPAGFMEVRSARSYSE